MRLSAEIRADRVGIVRRALRYITPFLLFSLLTLLSACGVDVPQNTFDPSGEVADKQRDIFLIAMWPLVAIMVVVEGLLILALILFRRRRGQPVPPQVHGNTRLEIGWTILPALFLLVLAIPTIIGIRDLATPPKGDVMTVEVTGRQFSWSFRYPDFQVTTTNELYIPVNKTVVVKLGAVDVIHSFWVPKLAGKQDAVPGRSGEMWFNAEEPGVYSGQCAEFCGTGHWQMRFTVIALTDEEFNQWVRQQQALNPKGEIPALTWRPEE